MTKKIDTTKLSVDKDKILENKYRNFAENTDTTLSEITVEVIKEFKNNGFELSHVDVSENKPGSTSASKATLHITTDNVKVPVEIKYYDHYKDDKATFLFYGAMTENIKDTSKDGRFSVHSDRKNPIPSAVERISNAIKLEK